MRIKYLCIILFIAFISSVAFGQTIPREKLIYYTQEWKGERFEDGRPRVSDDLLKRALNISIEEAWGYLRNRGYHNQFEGNWKTINNTPMVGRALTAQYMPNRPELAERMKNDGQKAGRIGSPNSWPIDMLQEGDIYIADSYGKIIDGTLIGDNLGNAIYAKSKNGVIFNGSLRDLEGLEKIEGFNAFVRGWDPSYIQEMMLMGLNTPIQIGRATILPGDIILAKREGIIAIPAHLAEATIINSEFVALRDQFGIQKLKEGKYTPGQIDTQWTDAIKKDFLSWLDSNPDLLPMSRKELDEFMKDRSW